MTSLGPGGSPVLTPKSNVAPSDKGSAPLKVNLLQFRKNVSDLRMQLHQMRQLQARPLSPLNEFRVCLCPFRYRLSNMQAEYRHSLGLLESSNISFTVCIRSAPEPGGASSAAEAGGTGNQCETCGGHEASGGPRPEAEGFGGGGQAQVLGLGGACPDTTRVRLLNMTLFVMFISCYDDFHEYKYQSPFISQS